MSNLTIEVLVLPFDMGRYDLIAKFFQFRKKVFIDQMSWPLHHHDGIETEQYDSYNTAYVIAHEDGEVIGGARLKRTDHKLGYGDVSYTYMIRDAHLGLLPGMPHQLCYDTPPTDPKCWELTRFAAIQRKGLAEGILEAANDYLHRLGADECLFLGAPAFLRMASRLGWTPQPLGDVVQNDDGRFLAFACPVRAPAMDMAAPAMRH